MVKQLQTIFLSENALGKFLRQKELRQEVPMTIPELGSMSF